ncbi:MAG: hypothetical protein ABL996_10080 [Micropepsaceae bacterium]
MRDWVAVAGVILLALGLGGAAAYMSVDLTPPGLELIRPPKPAVAARIKREETQRTVQAEASECKYCTAVADLAKTFSRRAETARTHAAALRAALVQVSDETDQAENRALELKAADAAAVQADAAAAVLTGWASRCVGEDMCKVAPVRMTAAPACATNGDPRTAAAVLIAMTVRGAAQKCASGTCPSIDCTASAGLQSDMSQIESALDAIGGRASRAPGQVNAAQLPVGPSTLKAELKRVADEAGYVTKMVPLLLDDSRAKLAGDKQQLPKLAPEMVDERALSVEQLSVVMEQAAEVSDAMASDPRREAAWRLKSLSAHLAAVGRDSQVLSGTQAVANWKRVADSLGGALLDMARLQAMLDRVGKGEAVSEGCDGSVASAAQQLHEASAMLDLCRMRSACIGRGGVASTVKASTGDLSATFERATATASALSVADIGEQQVIEAADGAPQPRSIDMLRSRGVCLRAGELREASAAAPAAAQAVAQAVVVPALTPTFVGALAPQDVIAGAVETAMTEPAPVESAEAVEPAETLVQAATRFSKAKPKRKPRFPVASDVVQAASPRTVDADAPYNAIVLPQVGGPGVAFGGEGGPQQLMPPPAEAPAAKP